VVRALQLSGVDVAAVRAENFSAKADVVTLRAVERFEAILPIAACLAAPRGHLVLLIGQAQVNRTRELATGLHWGEPTSIPQSSNRVLMIGYAPA
jgi:16S rRNA G527 N7-methylase RsmG